jgi:hypothetical protein
MLLAITWYQRLLWLVRYNLKFCTSFVSFSVDGSLVMHLSLLGITNITCCRFLPCRVEFCVAICFDRATHAPTFVAIDDDIAPLVAAIALAPLVATIVVVAAATNQRQQQIDVGAVLYGAGAVCDASRLRRAACDRICPVSVRFDLICCADSFCSSDFGYVCFGFF